MKKLLLISLIAIIFILIALRGCDKPITNESNLIQSNETLLLKVDSINKELAILNDSNELLTQNYINVLNKQDSVRIVIKTKYLTVFDTITKVDIECLPKIYVDELINSQDSVNLIVSKRLLVKDGMITLLTQSNSIKDTVIDNKDSIIEIKESEIKRHKKGKVRSFFAGAGVGLIGGYLLK